MELDPNSQHWIYALYLQAAGRYDESIDHYLLAEERNPTSEGLKEQVADAYSCEGRYDKAIDRAKALLARIEQSGRVGAQRDSVWLLNFTSRQLSMKGAHDEAIRAAERLRILSSDSVLSLHRLAIAYALAGRTDDAKSLLRTLETQPLVRREPWRVSAVYAALGDAGRAIELERTAPTTRLALAHYRCSEVYQLLPNAPEMREFVRPMGFPN
jgi:tetratricopeptide (TPR) repeat protein